jgi:hypothetical protein
LADILDSMAQYLQGLGLVHYDPTGVTGDCFIDTMPPQPDSAVALGAYGLGEPDPVSADDELGLQVRARGSTDPRISRRRCQDIYSALHGLADVPMADGTLLILATAVQTTTALGLDGNGRHEHVVNFHLHITNPTAQRG